MNPDPDRPAPRFWAKLIKGSTDDRPTRLHTQEGKLAPAAAYLRLPVAAMEWLGLKLFGHRVERPWIPPAATRRIARRLPPGASVLEIGAGMSTLWLAPRCAKLVSIEADRSWFDGLGKILAERKLAHVDLRFRWVAHEMYDFSTIPDRSLDLCFVDGGPRRECLEAALPKLKPNGLIYVDNTDLYLDAKEAIVAAAQARACRLTFHRGFAPACLFVNEGALLELTPAR